LPKQETAPEKKGTTSTPKGGDEMGNAPVFSKKTKSEGKLGEGNILCRKNETGGRTVGLVVEGVPHLGTEKRYSTPTEWRAWNSEGESPKGGGGKRKTLPVRITTITKGKNAEKKKNRDILRPSGSWWEGQKKEKACPAWVNPNP